MKGRETCWPRASVCAVTIVAIIALSLAVVAPADAKQPAPKNRYYFMVAVGFYADYDVSAECFKFTNKKMKALLEPGIGGKWNFIEKGEQAEIHVDVAAPMLIEGMPIDVTVDGYGRIDDRGARSAFGGAAQLNIPAFSAISNFAMAGREVKKKKQCIKMARDFNKLVGFEN